MFYDDYGNSFIPISQGSQENDLKTKKEQKKYKKSDKISKKSTWIPKTIYAKNFLFNNLKNNKNSRYVSVLGHLHHGKSTLVNVISSSVHLINERSLFQEFSDFFYMEKQRGISLQSSITTLLLCNRKGKSCIFSLIDCPGHLEFFDQSLIGIKISDGALIVVDVADGVLIGTELSLRNSIFEGLSIVVILNAIDRLIIEYGYSPKTSHKKIIHILDELNSILEECIIKSNIKNIQKIKFFNPIYNNVCFASFLQGWSFTLEQYSEIYISCQPSISLSIGDLSLKFWNNFHYEEKEFSSKKTMFANFILEPLYKLTFLSISEPALHVQKFFEIEFGLSGINYSELLSNREKLTGTCFSFFLGGCRQSNLTSNHTGLISAILRHIPCFKKTLSFKKDFFKKTIGIYCIGYIYKFCPSRDNGIFYALARIVKGSLRNNTYISLITEGHKFYSNQKFYLLCEIEEIFLPIGRYNINIPSVSVGSIVFIKGIHAVIRRSAVFFEASCKFKNMENFYFSFIKILLSVGLTSSLIVSLEPLYSFQLKKLYISLRKCCKIYPALSCETDPAGAIEICGPGELYLDCVLHDTRLVFETLDIKASNPLPISKETIESNINNDESYIGKKVKVSLYKNFSSLDNIYLSTKNEIFPMKKNKFSFNYWKNLKNSINSGLIVKNFEDSEHGDKLNANSVWFFGPQGTSLSSCCLTGKFDSRKISFGFKNKIKKSFNLAVNEGPLSFEPLYQTKFQLKCISKDFLLSFEDKNFSGDMRRILHEMFLKNCPSICEPHCFLELKFHFKFFSTIIKLIKLKMGYLLSSRYLSEENVFIIRFGISLLKSIELESELNFLTNKSASLFMFPDGWEKTSTGEARKNQRKSFDYICEN
nr:U5 small nuclear ribonucleoprotein 116 kDa subunit [Cryptomonas sp.]